MVVKQKEKESKSIFSDKQMYDIYNIELHFREKCYAGMPKSEKILKKWIESKGEMPLEKLEEKTEVLDLVEETETVSCGFRRNKKGEIFLRDFQTEALLKQCGTTLGIFMAHRGSKGIAQHGLHIHPREIYFIGKKKEDGFEDIAGHVMTPQGKRSILKRTDYVMNGKIRFQILLLKGQTKLTEKNLRSMLQLGQDNGIGSCRSLGGGRFDVVKFEKA